MVYILLTLLLGLGAVNTGNNLLYLLVSALLGFLAVSGILGRANLRGLQVSVETPEEIYDGVETLVSVRVRNLRKRLPAYLLQMTVQESALSFRLIEPGGTETGTATAVFIGRGKRTMLPVRVRSPFPVNFFVRSLSLPVAGTAIVFPAPRPCRANGNAGRSRDPGGYAALGWGDDGDLRGIADYTGSEPLRRIHWKLSARQGRLKVKELSAAGGEPVILELERLPGDGLEERLRSGAFLINRLARQNRPVGLRLQRRLIPPAHSRAHRLRLLRELALYGQD